MEQENSLRTELKNLTELQAQQLKVLNEMKAGDETREGMRQADKQRMEASFSNQSMYRAATPHTPMAGTQSLFNPFPNPNPNAMNLSGIYNQNGFVSNASSLVGRNNQYGFFGTMNPGTNVSNMSRVLTTMDYSSRLTKTGVAGAGVAGSLGATMAGSALLPGIGGLMLGATGGLLIGAGAGVINEEIDKNSALKKYIYKNSNRFINPKESNNERDIAGFSRSETNDAADFVRTMNDEFYMKDEETMQLLQKFTEGGMLKSATDLKSFKEKMLSLTKTVKEGALILNESYESIADLLAEMRKAGIDAKDYKELMGMGNIIGSLNGEGGSETIRNLLDFVKALNAGTPNDGNLSMSRAETTSLYMADYYNKLESNEKRNHDENANYNMIKNLGGPTQAGMHVQMQIEKIADHERMQTIGNYAFDWNAEKSSWEFDKKKYKELLESTMSVEEISGKISNKFNKLTEAGQGEAILDWKREQGTYLRNNLKDGELTDLVYKAVDMYKKDEAMKGHSMTGETILDQFFGVKDVGTQKLLYGFMQHQTQNPMLKREMDIQNMWQQKVASVDAKTPSLSEMLSSGLEKTKDFFTGGFVKLDNAIGEGIQNTMDWIYGRNKRIGPKPEYGETFTLGSDINSTSSDDVRKAINQSNEVLASTKDAIEKLNGNGYSIDEKVLGVLDDKLSSVEKVVEYSRDIITDWSKVDKDIEKNKGTIQDLAEKNDLSETIVAALHKYNQAKPNNEKIDMNQTTKKLGEETFNYGGNSALALAATMGGRDKVDAALSSMNINIEGLRQAGAQEAVQNININDLGLDKGLTDKVTEVLNQKIGGINVTKTTTTTSGQQTNTSDLSLNQIVNTDLREKVNFSAEQLDKVIESQVAYQEKATGRRSEMRGKGQMFLDAQEATGVNAAYIMAHAGLESRWGTSDILKAKNNWFGIGAFDSSPMASAYTFDSMEDGLIKGVEWINKNYISSDKHKQNTLTKMRFSDSGTHNYATDGKWHEKIGNTMQNIYKKAGGIPITTEVIEEFEEFNEVGVKKKEVKKYADGKAPKTAGEILYERGSKLDAKNDGSVYKAVNLFQSGNKDISSDEFKNAFGILGNDSKNIETVLMESYSGIIKKIKAYVDKETDSTDYKDWIGMSAGDKLSQIKFVQSLNENDVFRGLLKDNGGSASKDEKYLDLTGRLFTDEERELMKRIDKDGFYRGDSRQEITIQEAIDRLEKYNRGGNQKQDKETTDKKYNLAKEGFKEETTKSKVLGNFIDGVGGTEKKTVTTEEIKKQTFKDMNSLGANSNWMPFGDDGNVFKRGAMDYVTDFVTGMPINGFAVPTGTAKIKTKATLQIGDFIDEFEKAMSDGGVYKDANDLINRNGDVGKIADKFKGMFNDKNQGEDILMKVANELYNNIKKGSESGTESNYSTLQRFGENVMGITLKDFNGNVKAYNAELAKGAESFYSDNHKGYLDFINNKDTKESKVWQKLSTSEKSNVYETMKLLEGALGKGGGKNSIENIEKDNKKSKEDIFTSDEKQKMKYVHKREDGSYYYDSSKVNEEASVKDFDAWQRQGGEKVRSSDTLSTLIEAEKKLKLSDDKDVTTMSSGELMARVVESIEKVSSELMKTTVEVQEKTKKLYSNESLDATVKGEGLFKLSKSEMQAYNNALKSKDKNLMKTFKESLKSEFEEIARLVNEGDVTGLNKLMETMKKSGREIDEAKFNKIIELAEKIGSVETEELMKVLKELENINAIASDVGKTALLLRDLSLDGSGKDTSITIETEKVLKQDILSRFDGNENNSKDMQALVSAIREDKADMSQIMELLINPEKTTLTQAEVEQLAGAISSANEVMVNKIVGSNTENLNKILNSDIWKTSQAGEKEVVVKQNTDEGGKALEKAKDTKVTLDQAAEKIKVINKEIELNKTKDEKLVAKLEEDKAILTENVTKTFLEAIQETGKINETATKTVDEANKTAEKTASTFADTFAKYDGAIGSAITTMNNRITSMEGKVSSYGSSGGASSGSYQSNTPGVVKRI